MKGTLPSNLRDPVENFCLNFFEGLFIFMNEKLKMGSPKCLAIITVPSFNMEKTIYCLLDHGAALGCIHLCPFTTQNPITKCTHFDQVPIFTKNNEMLKRRGPHSIVLGVPKHTTFTLRRSSDFSNL